MTIKALVTAAVLSVGLAFTGSPAWALSSGGSSAPKPSSSDYDAGKKAADAGDYTTAITRLKKAVASDPTSADAYNLLGYSYRKLGDTDAAFKNYRTALDLNGMHRGAHDYLGELYLEMDNLAEAEKLLHSLGRACTYSCGEYKELKAEVTKYKTAHGS